MKKAIILVLMLSLLFGGSTLAFGQDVPVLMYHHIIDEAPTNSSTVSTRKITKDFMYLKQAGYNFLTLEDLVELEDYPEKSIVITFDDGYESNYLKAFPVMKALDIKASISLIGYYLNKETVDGHKHKPKLSFEQIREMQESGLVDFQNHTYNLHYPEGFAFSGEKVGTGVLPFLNEDQKEYQTRLKYDILLNHYYIYYLTNDMPEFFCFPYGRYNDTVTNLLKQLGYKGTITTNPGFNKINTNSSKFNLNRYNVSEDTNLKELLEGGN